VPLTFIPEPIVSVKPPLFHRETATRLKLKLLPDPIQAASTVRGGRGLR
jgi:hypothetical protein